MEDTTDQQISTNYVLAALENVQMTHGIPNTES